MSIDTGGRRYLAWLGTESGYQPLRADLGTHNGYREVSRHRRREVVKITLGAAYAARDQFRAALTARGLSYSAVEEIPFDIELVGVGTARNMFFGCASLTHVPDMDTSQVTSMNYMFYNCASLTTVPDLDTSSVTGMYAMFQGCSSLTSVPDLDTSNVTSMASMFLSCAALTDGNVRLIGKHPSVNTADMITGSGLTRLPFYDADGNPI